MNPLALIFLCLATSLVSVLGQGGSSEAKKANLPKPAYDAPERIEMARVQILLDRAGYRPGKIDGLGGEFTQRAAERYIAANNLPPNQLLDLSSVQDPYTSYTIREEDAQWLGPQRSTPVEQSKLKAMKYADYWELVAEKFHCDKNFLRELNPGVAEELAPGVSLRVPDVEPFDMQAVVDLEKQRREEAKARKKAEEEAKASPSPTPDSATPSEAPSPTASPSPAVSPSPTPDEPQRRLVLLLDQRMIELYEDDRMVAAFPCTPGSSKVPVPKGTWKVIANVLMPYYRWDKSVLESGVKSDTFYNLPPGPNNPVGIVWMAINRPSVGMHGTPWPDMIGRNESSGCIRLSNWDAFTLSQKIRKGTPLEVK